jgi:signal transduction histidine kinase
MAELSNSVIRPYSHDLFKDFPTFEGSKEAGSRKIDWRQSLRRILQTPLISPGALAGALTYLGFLFTISGPPSIDNRETIVQLGDLAVSVSLSPLIEALSVVITIFVSTFIASKAVSAVSAPIRKVAPKVSGWGFLILQLVVIAVLTLALILLGFFLPWFPQVEANLFSVLLGIFLSLLTVTTIIVAIRGSAWIRSESTLEIQKLNESLRREVALTNEKLWQERQQLARVIHGPLQSAVNAASIQLGTVTDKGRDLPELVRNLSANIMEALAKIDGESTATNTWRSELEELRLMWENVAEVRVSFSLGSETILDLNPVAAGTAIQIISEALANAAIHGLATVIEVSISTRENAMKITVSDNGAGPGSNSELGLGSKFLDDVSLEWSLERRDETVLSVSIPC